MPRILTTLLAAGALSGCAAMLSAPTPMPAQTYLRETEAPRRCLLVLMPGRGDRAPDFAAHGFIDAVRRRPLSVDVVAPDAVFGYYARRTLIERLREDVLEPARERGYEQVWIAGISMGGLGSLLLSRQDPGFAGVALFAPFLGDEEVIEEIAAAGGPAAWRPGEIDEDDYQRDLWRWLQGVLARDEPRIYLAYGEQDRMAAAHRLLASALPSERVLSTEGGHDWATWSKLWESFLERSEFAQRCAEPAAR